MDHIVSETPTVETTYGPIPYIDSGGDGPTLVFLHGLLMNEQLWTAVVDDLQADHRCIVPLLPLGAHTTPVPADADLSLRGLAGLVSEIVDQLDLEDVMLIGNDTGGAIAQLAIAHHRTERVRRLGLIACEAFDNVPPGLTGKTVVAAGKLSPRLFGLFMQQMRIKAIRRLPIAFGWLTRRGDAITRAWMQPLLKDNAIRRDATALLRSLGRHRDALTDITHQLSSFDLPVLILWAANDRVMPPEHGERLADLLPDSTLVVLDDTRTLIPLDQPTACSSTLRSFIKAQTTTKVDQVSV